MQQDDGYRRFKADQVQKEQDALFRKYLDPNDGP